MRQVVMVKWPGCPEVELGSTAPRRQQARTGVLRAREPVVVSTHGEGWAREEGWTEVRGEAPGLPAEPRPAPWSGGPGSPGMAGHRRGCWSTGHRSAGHPRGEVAQQPRQRRRQSPG